jgi:hypothetical protein
MARPLGKAAACSVDICDLEIGAARWWDAPSKWAGGGMTCLANIGALDEELWPDWREA